MMARKAYMADLRGRVSSAEGPAHVGPDGSLCLAPDCERQLHESPATRIKAASRNVRRSRALRAQDCAGSARLGLDSEAGNLGRVASAIDAAFADAEGRVIRTRRWARSAAAPT